MERIIDLISQTTGLKQVLLLKITYSALILVVLFLLRFIIMKIIWRQTDNVKTRYLWKKTLSYITITILIFAVGRVWFQGFQVLGTFLGLLSAGIAIALKDLLANIAGWIFILTRRPFSLGDRIELEKIAGDVIDIRIFQFTVMEIGNWVDAEQSTGRIIHIPNGKVFTVPIANYSKGFQYIWNEIPVTVTFESDWRKAKELLEGIVTGHAEHLSKRAEEKIKEASSNFMIYYSILTPTVYTKVIDIGVTLTIRFLVEPRKRRNSEQVIWEEILNVFDMYENIQFAYPTQRFYTEGENHKRVQ